MVQTNKQLILFFGIILVGIILNSLAQLYLYLHKMDINAIGNFPVYLPGIAAIVVCWLYGNRNTVPKKFFITYFATVIAYIISLPIKFKHPGLIILLGCLVGWGMLLMEGKEKRKEWGLSFSVNWKKSLLFILLFIVYVLLFMLVVAWWYNMPVLTNSSQLLIYILRFPVVFIGAYFVSWSQEYAWRYFLQPILQQKFGKRAGILLVGCIWGIWFVLNMFFYVNLKAWLPLILNQFILFVCLGVFIGYVYMKTKNIWTSSFFYLFILNLNIDIEGGRTMQFFNQAITWEFSLLLSGLYCIAFLPFLIAKEFNKNI